MNLDRLRGASTGAVLRAAMCAFTAAFLIMALCAPDVGEMLGSLKRICTLPAQSNRDYFAPALGSVSGAMFNTFLVSALCCAMMFLPGARVNGGTVLAFFLTSGYCFYGMNILNVLPLMLGVFVYARIRREPFSRYISHAMFATGAAPLITYALFYYPDVAAGPRFTFLGLALAIAIGLLFGLALPPLCAHTMAFHKGYDLFNAGCAVGFLCFVFNAVLHKALGIDAPAFEAVMGEGRRAMIDGFFIVTFGLCALCGAALNGGFRGYGALLRETGYDADFTGKYGPGLNLLNMGVYGLFIVAFFNLIGVSFTGPTMGGIFGMLCGCCLGATPLNVWPMMAGYVVMGLLNRAGLVAYPVNINSTVTGLSFASGLAPLAGVYGPVAGIAAGMLHYCLITSVPAIHGGFNLFNGGFTAGIVCFVMVPLLEHYRRPRRARDPKK